MELLIRAFESRGKRRISAMKGMASPDIEGIDININDNNNVMEEGLLF